MDLKLGEIIAILVLVISIGFLSLLCIATVDHFATYSAAAAAIFAAYYSYSNSRFQKIDRAYSHSIYKSAEYLNARNQLRVLFPEWENEDKIKPLPKEIEQRFLKDEEKKDALNIVLNHWGRFADEYYDNILDKRRAQKLLQMQFYKFFSFFQEYINLPKNGRPRLPSNQYKNFSRLVNEWRN